MPDYTSLKEVSKRGGKQRGSECHQIRFGYLFYKLHIPEGGGKQRGSECHLIRAGMGCTRAQTTPAYDAKGACKDLRCKWTDTALWGTPCQATALT